MDDFLAFTLDVSIIFAIAMVPVALIAGVIMWLEVAICASQSGKMGLEYSWGPLQECMVKVDGQWMLFDSYTTIVKIRP